jgi:hypothetical protein
MSMVRGFGVAVSLRSCVIVLMSLSGVEDFTELGRAANGDGAFARKWPAVSCETPLAVASSRVVARITASRSLRLGANPPAGHR